MVKAATQQALHEAFEVALVVQQETRDEYGDPRLEWDGVDLGLMLSSLTSYVRQGTQQDWVEVGDDEIDVWVADVGGLVRNLTHERANSFKDTKVRPNLVVSLQVTIDEARDGVRIARQALDWIERLCYALDTVKEVAQQVFDEGKPKPRPKAPATQTKSKSVHVAARRKRATRRT